MDSAVKGQAQRLPGVLTASSAATSGAVPQTLLQCCRTITVTQLVPLLLVCRLCMPTCRCEQGEIHRQLESASWRHLFA